MQRPFDAEDRLRDLEWRLDRYHEHLEESLEHDRQFQMKATWGIVKSASGMLAILALLFAGNKMGLDGWVWGIVLGIGAIFAFGLGVMWGERGHEDDLKKLSRLPKWRTD